MDYCLGDLDKIVLYVRQDLWLWSRFSSEACGFYSFVWYCNSAVPLNELVFAQVF
jgi:hypothetical protein